MISRNSICSLILLWSLCSSVCSQVPSFFLGKKNIVGAGLNFYYQDLAGEAAVSNETRGVKKNMLSALFYYERLSGMKRAFGLSVGFNRFMMYDKPNLYANDNYQIESGNGKIVKVVNGSGKIYASEYTVWLYMKRYSVKRRPYGFFFSWKAGLSNYSIKLDKAYTFRSVFDNTNIVDYKIAEPEIANFRHFIWAWEGGKSTRFFDDKLILNYSVTIPVTFKLGGSNDLLTKRFISESNRYLIGYKAMHINVSLGYVL